MTLSVYLLEMKDANSRRDKWIPSVSFTKHFDEIELAERYCKRVNTKCRHLGIKYRVAKYARNNTYAKGEKNG